MGTESNAGDGQPPAAASAAVNGEIEGYIDKRECARRLGKTVRTVDTWMAKGWIPLIRVGRTVAFRWSEVDDYIRGHFRVGATH
jgi:excisionase family DNA binding protein